MAKKPTGFAAEFAKQRSKLGAGKTFTYQGKSYSTNRADDKPAAKPAAKPAGMASSPRPKAKPTEITGGYGGMATSPRPKTKPVEITGGYGGMRVPNAGGKYSPTEEMRVRNERTANMAKPAGAASSSASTPTGMASSPRPKARPTEALAANGGVRQANANRKYSPTEEMRMRAAKKEK